MNLNQTTRQRRDNFRNPHAAASAPLLLPPLLAALPDLPDRWPMLQGQLVEIGSGPLGPLNLIALLASAAIWFIAWQAWSTRPRLANGREHPDTRVPDLLHPALAGALASGNVNDAQMQATILDLARRGALRIEPDDDERDKVQLRLLDVTSTRNEFESELLRLIEQRARDGVVRYRDLARLRGEWGRARRALRVELETRGWFNPRSRQYRLPFLVTGFIALSIAGASILAAIIAGSGWPVLGAFVAGVTGLIVLGMASIYPSTTSEGEREALKWRGFRSGLARARDDAHGTVDLDDVFPYIVALNMAAAYNRHLRRASQSGYVPAWFGPGSDVTSWPDGWHDYWIALHSVLAPTDSANTRTPGGSVFQRYVTGGRS